MFGRLWELQSILVDLKANGLEIESLLGEQFRCCLDPLEELFKEYRMNISLYLDADYKKGLNSEQRTILDRIVYGSRDLETDIFGGNYEAEVSRLIKEMSKFLLKKK